MEHGTWEICERTITNTQFKLSSINEIRATGVLCHGIEPQFNEHEIIVN